MTNWKEHFWNKTVRDTLLGGVYLAILAAFWSLAKKGWDNYSSAASGLFEWLATPLTFSFEVPVWGIIIVYVAALVALAALSVQLGRRSFLLWRARSVLRQSRIDEERQQELARVADEVARRLGHDAPKVPAPTVTQSPPPSEDNSGRLRLVLSPFTVNLVTFAIFDFLKRIGRPATAAEISDKRKLDREEVLEVLYRLELDGLVEWDTDRYKRKLYALTPKGVAAAK
ncbi:hypothetical protein FEA48_23520 [Pseudomonas nitroreducens]|uniref:Uncharacterized protein n=1 Tax=Pseudomonas nitroreducens TaxID=46680 RepID=A0A5R8ZY72_PSENT|nr:hypothetical protein [Pseudomonas nitroreducens]TLP70805.1 hypothetical protein FEA48_23520 [Pseudomonas nitroreducens]